MCLDVYHFNTQVYVFHKFLEGKLSKNIRILNVDNHSKLLSTEVHTV